MTHLLVVSDGLVANILRQEGYTIIEANNPLEALEIAKVRKDDIAAVVTDIATQPISGLVLANRLFRQNTPIPIFFMASQPIAGAIAGGLGNNGLIERPFSSLGLTRELTKFLAKSTRARESRHLSSALTQKSIRANLPAPVRTLFRNRPLG